MHFATFPGGITGYQMKLACNGFRTDKGRQLIAQGVRELWDSSTQETVGTQLPQVEEKLD